ncbi:hypothetical protein GCM10011390_44210 [Aureimonas endophytica]|uniref:Uncharacterized protein n=1 Tax=Aureimonas endophytica TaxID=2027858 RepID=A0A916ZZH5_9HYPH|nr:hypothetical protein GCM10011390_44210 [Aureimonas endophytica]
MLRKILLSLLLQSRFVALLLIVTSLGYCYAYAYQDDNDNNRDPHQSPSLNTNVRDAPDSKLCE